MRDPRQTDPIGMRLGAFVLEGYLGRGGMADVWRGRHAETGQQVAIKILSGFAAQRPAWREAFRQEIRTVAGLSHPAIVHVDEFGEVPDGFAAEIHPGSPYLVMELVPGGNMVKRLGKVSWQDLKEILVRVLDGLAHAHARGLVHRDIKPGNVIGRGEGVKLADFGICHDVSDPSERKDHMAGTPAYMAPEQWSSAWRDFGPWTDLYGLGCLAWGLATGAPPFGRGVDARTLHRRHLLIDPPDFEPAQPMPRGLDGWLRSLLVKEPTARVQRAADALWSLMDLEEQMVGGVGAPDVDSGPTPTFLDTRWSVVLPDVGHGRDDSVLTAPKSAGAAALRIPRSWRRGTSGTPRLLPGAGRSLFGFRSARLVGREAEQDRLWAALLDTVEAGRPRVVVLQGEAGCGKSRLARWMTERCHEVGAAEVLRVDCDAAQDPLVDCVVEHLAVRRADPEERLQRIQRHLAAYGEDNPYEAAALRDFLSAAMDRTTRSIAAVPADANARLVAPVALMQRLCSRRPVVLWLDDLHQRPQLLDFVLRLDRIGFDLPVLILATVRDDLPGASDVFRGLEEMDRKEYMHIGSLPRRAWGALASSVLVLAPELAEQVGQRAAGNPLFAVQLVADWVQRNLLVESPVGFGLRAGVAMDLPDGLHQVWQERIADLLADRPAADGQALEIAALLGARVDEVEWLAACRASGAEPSPDLAELLLARQLTTAAAQLPGAPRQWAFTHGLLRESLHRRAAEGGRAADNHRACAVAILAARDAFAAERAGRHYLDADDPERAIDPLLAAAAERVDLGDWERAERLVALREDALDALDAPRTDARRARNEALLAGMELGRNRPDRAVEIATRLLQVASDEGWTDLDANARLVLARSACSRGDLPQARDQFEAAELLAEEIDDLSMEVNSRAGLGLVRLLEGQLGTAREATRAARAGYAEFGDAHGVAAMNLQLSWIAAQAGELTRASRRVDEAARQFEALGARSAVAQCHTQRGWLARALGDPQGAAEALGVALELNEALGGAGALVPLVKLGILQTEAGDLDSGRRSLEGALQGLEGIGAWDAMGVLQVLLLPSCAAAEDWDAWDRLLPEAEVILAGTALADDSVATFARQAGDLAHRAGERVRAERAWLLALGQLRRLGRLVEARDLQAQVLSSRATPARA